MNGLRKFIVLMFGLAVAVATSVLVMIRGWGLEPQSWWWIIGVSLFGQTFALIIIEVAKKD